MTGRESIFSNPGRGAQAIGTARFLGQDPNLIHERPVGVLGTVGDSQCYLGVREKVSAIQIALANRIDPEGLRVRLLDPFFSGGVSDGQRNGTPQMRYSLIGREATNDGFNLHLSGSEIEGTIAVVACDKPPVGTLAALLEHNCPAIMMSDGSIRPGMDPETGERIDIVSCFQVAGDPDVEKRQRYAEHACPGYGSCGGMFTYNTMQSFIAVLGMEPLHMVAPASEDYRRISEFPDQLVNYLQVLIEKNIKPTDIVTPASLRNAVTVAIAMGGSTNVVLHAPEIARAAGIDFWQDVMTQDEFNELSARVPVLVNARPFGEYSMVDIDEKGGLQVITKELLDQGFLDGDCITCTGETLREQIERLNPPLPDGEVIYSYDRPYKETGGLRILSGNLAPEGGAVIKIAGIEGGVENGLFEGKARCFNSEKQLIEALETNPDIFQDKDMVVIRYEGPKGAPGMPELLDPTSRITTLCRQKNITIALMTDARFSGGSVGLVVGHVAPEAYLGGPIALVEAGDTIVVDLNKNTLNCLELDNPDIERARKAAWQLAAQDNGGVHPDVKPIKNRLLERMRAASVPALQGAGIHF